MKEEYQFLEDIIKEGSTSFYRAFRTLPRDRAMAVFAVYGICRLLDDTVDRTGSREELEKEKERFLQVEAGVLPMDPLWRAFSHFYKKYRLKPEPFLMMFQGQAYDLDFRPFSDLDALDRYCDLVAGSVGLMLLPILSDKAGPEIQETALAIGRAMQYTNILRDVKEDQERQRSYIPRSLGEDPRAAYEIMAERSLALYRQGLEGLGDFRRDSRYPLILAIFYYRGILEKIIAQGYPVQAGRIYLKPLEKIAVALRARAYALWRYRHA